MWCLGDQRVDGRVWLVPHEHCAPGPPGERAEALSLGREGSPRDNEQPVTRDPQGGGVWRCSLSPGARLATRLPAARRGGGVPPAALGPQPGGHLGLGHVPPEAQEDALPLAPRPSPGWPAVAPGVSGISDDSPEVRKLFPPAGASGRPFRGIVDGSPSGLLAGDQASGLCGCVGAH